MKILVVGLLALVLAMVAAVAVLTQHGPAKKAAAVIEERSASGFTQVEITGIANVTLVQGESEGVSLEGPRDAVTAIKTSVHNGTLKIRAGPAARAPRWWQMFHHGGTGPSAHVTIRLRQLDRLEAAGSVKVTTAALRGDHLHLDLAGACEVRMSGLALAQLSVDGGGATKLELAGSVRQQDIDLSGAGSYQASDLLSETTTIDVSGAGKALVNSSKTLSVDISGAGSVEYLGDPKLEQSVSGVGKLRRREPR